MYKPVHLEFVAMTRKHEKLLQLYERLQAERRRILANSTELAESEFPPS